VTQADRRAFLASLIDRLGAFIAGGKIHW